MNETICAHCGITFLQKGGKGHPKRQYCSDACRQAAYRHRKQQEQEERLEQVQAELRQLRARLDIDSHARNDTQVRHFKAWLRKQPHPQDSDFAKRFIADTRLKEHASRGMYVAQLRTLGYSTEDRAQFEDLWASMLLQL